MELTTEQKWDAIKNHYKSAIILSPGEANGDTWRIWGDGDIGVRAESRDAAIADAYSRLPSQAAPEPLSGGGASGNKPWSDYMRDHGAEDYAAGRQETYENVKKERDFLRLQIEVYKCKLVGRGVSDGEMGDEQWVKARYPESRAWQSPHSAWWMIETGPTRASLSQYMRTSYEAWADARRRLTPEAAAEEVDYFSEKCSICQQSRGGHLVTDAGHAFASPAPALKAQEFASEPNPFETLKREHFDAVIASRNDLASLAKKLALVLESRHLRDRKISRRNHEYMLASDSCYREEIVALAEAKKAGCA